MSILRPHVRRAASIGAAFGAALAACHDAPSATRGPQVEVLAGNEQHGLVGAELPEVVVVRVTGAARRPLAGVRVTWEPESDQVRDEVTALTATTDATGRVAARWRLGGGAGRHVVRVTADGAPPTELVAWADGGSRLTLRAIGVATYDGSGEAVHPDVALGPGPPGVASHLILTPYPRGNPSFENPSIFDGDGGATWRVPAGAINPIVTPARGTGYLSDPDAVYDPAADELRVYYRAVSSENQVWLVRSRDAAHWSAPVLVARAPSHAIVSPSVVRRDATEWLMWSVNAGPAGCTAASTTVELRRSADGVAWSAPERVDLAFPAGDGGGGERSPWHLDVAWVAARREFWAVFPVKRAGDCTTTSLRFARSADGVHWTVAPGAVLRRGALPELQDVVYRASVGYDGASDVVTLWYSGARYERGAYSWRLAVEQLTGAELEARVATAGLLAAGAEEPRRTGVPALTGATAP